MAGEKYADKAVAKLAAYLAAQYPAQLRIVETAQSLTTNSLTDPVAYVQADLPDDGRSPLMEIWEESGDPIDRRNTLDAYDLTVAVTYAGDADIAAGRLRMRRYMTALIDCLRADPTLSSTVQLAFDKDRSFDVARGKDSATKHVCALGVEVHVHDP